MTTLPAIVNVDLHFTVYEPCTVTFDANGHGTAPAALENVPSATEQPAAACGLLALECLRRKG